MIERMQTGPRMSQVVIHSGTVYLAGQVMHASLRGAPKIASVGRQCDGGQLGAITLETGHAQRGKHLGMCLRDAAAIGQDFSAAHNAGGQSMHGCDQRAFQALGGLVL